jgi:23S rRNA pseudouridine2605 synthase
MKRNNDKNTSKEVKNSEPELIRLNKYIANAGICSRREADKMISDGKITVNGNQVTEMGFKVGPKDHVAVSGKKTEIRRKLTYLLLNKPKGYITTTKDPQERKTVMELVANATSDRVYPVGRLDRNSSGLLILTNDGELTNELTHPSYNIKKIYAVTLDKALAKEDYMKVISEGIQLDDGLAKVDEMEYTDPKDLKKLGISIHSGRNRIIRRLFEAMGYEVKKLDRVMFGMLTKRELPSGKWRHLNEKEVRILKGQMQAQKKP